MKKQKTKTTDEEIRNSPIARCLCALPAHIRTASKDNCVTTRG